MSTPRRWTDDQLRAAVPVASTMAEVCRALGLVPRGANYENLWRRIDELGIAAAHLHVRRLPHVRGPALDDEAIRRAVRGARSVEQVCHLIGVPATRRVAVRGRIAALGLDTSHFLGQGWRLGIPGLAGGGKRARPLDEVLVAGRAVSSSGHLRRRLIDSGLKTWCCEACGRHEWEGQAIPLELDHVNGDRRDNRLENLRLLCPNCHAQTPTYRGRNIGRRGGIG